MARARNIKPSFFKNEDLAECPALARLLFAGLWVIADREGRLEDRPKRIKAEVLPYDDCDCDALLFLLSQKGFIIRYEAQGNKYIQILKFSEHQKPHPNETESLIPAPQGLHTKVESPSNQGDEHSALNSNLPSLALKPPLPPEGSGSLPVGNGKEGKKAQPWAGMERLLDDNALQAARNAAPGWDIYYLCRTYDAGIAAGERDPPKIPAAAFPKWCAAYTKGKSP